MNTALQDIAITQDNLVTLSRAETAQLKRNLRDTLINMATTSISLKDYREFLNNLLSLSSNSKVALTIYYTNYRADIVFFT